MQQDLSEAMRSGPILPLLARMATPQALGFFVQSGVSVAEIWFIGQLGTSGLAAMALVFPLLMLMQMLSGGALGGAVTGSVARAIGGQQTEKAQSLIWQVLYLSVAVALLFVLIHLVAGEWILRTLGGHDEILTQALAYTGILFPGCLLIWLSNMLMGVARGTGNMKLPAKLMVLASVVQVPLSGLLILGFGPIPQLGIQGAAVSILTVNFMNVVILLYLFSSGRMMITLQSQFARLRVDLLGDILAVGALAAVSPFFTVLSILILTGLVGTFGVAPLAGYGIAARVEFLVIPLVFGIGVSMNSMVGFNIGNGDYARAERIGWTGAVTAGVLTGFAGILLAVFPSFWVSIFTDDPEALAVATSYFRIIAPFFGFLGMGLSLYFASQGARAVGWPVVATGVRFLVSVGAGWLLVTRFNGTASDLFWCIAVAILLYWAITCAAIYWGAWRRGLPSKVNAAGR